MLAIFLILCKDHSLKGYMKAYNRTLFFIFLFSIWFYTVRQRVLNDRRPGFLAVGWFGPLPPPPPPRSPDSKLDRRHTGRREREATFQGGGRGWARNQIIRPRGSLAFYKSFNTLWCTNTYSTSKKQEHQIYQPGSGLCGSRPGNFLVVSRAEMN